MTCDDEQDGQSPSGTRKGESDARCSSNGEFDWRRMFDKEIACDITIDVDGMLIKAHKSVLIFRCQYFAAMFSGKINEAINIMYLDGFSFECVHFALCQIYSGDMDIPQNIDIFELADLADLLCLEGLKELVMHMLEYDYFHKFHKPCEECSILISKFLPWSGAIGYSDIYYKILLWIKQYSDEIWSRKEFALLPDHIIKKCFLHHALDIDSENVLNVLQSCDRLMYALPKVTWTNNIFRLTLRLLRECLRYVRLHLVDVLSAETFYCLGTSGSVDSPCRLEDHLTAAIERANPIQVCAAYAQLHRMLRVQIDEMLPEWQRLLSRLTIHCEDALICCGASQAMRTSAWLSLQPDLQARIQSGSGVLTSGLYSKYMQNVNKYTRECNVEKIKRILYSQLGSINRVSSSGVVKQPLPNTAMSKTRVVAPGNSMVSSTKVSNNNNTNLRNGKTNIPVPKANYKNVKSRYLNPKPTKASEPEIAKPVVCKNSLQQGIKINTASSKLIYQKKYFDLAKGATVAETIRKSSIHSSIDRVNVYPTTNYKQVLNKKVSKSENSIGQQQAKIWPLPKEKSSIIAYVSPYSIRALDTTVTKTQKSVNATKTQKVTAKTSQLNSNFSSPSRSVFPSPKLKNDLQDSKNSKINYKKLSNANSKPTKRTVYEPKQKSSHISKDKNGLSNTDSYSSNDNSINFFLERSRTFVKSEPSVISKEITMDSSIEMYPQ